MAPKQRRRPKPAIPENDSWGLLLRDLALFGGKWGVVAVAVLWVAELPPARRLPGVAWLPTISDKPLLGRIPPAAHLLHMKEPAAQHAAHQQPGHQRKPTHHKAKPTAEPVAAATPVPATPTPMPATPTPAPVAAAPVLEAPVPAATAPAPVAALPPRTGTGGVKHGARAVNSVPVQVVTVDLLDPTVVATVALANNAARPNVAGSTSGDEPFGKMVKRLHAAAVVNGTFFSKDAEKRVMGNMVRDGALIKFSQWDHDGTTFALGAGNRPLMRTPGADGGPEPWDRSWLALTAGPRLLRNGITWCRPEAEGFRDDHVLGSAGRTALGFDRAGRKLHLVSFEAAVPLTKAAEVMRAIGCHEAMNLDGGASRSMAVAGRVVVPAGRELTNVLAFYDRKHPAPRALRTAFEGFRPEAEAQ